ncbi:hypothetical protein [Embleya sp. NPDC020886]|uniref:hypothetical protein n=1 Tax=Embleya sp. NPDC020886 TaxID=3363980 RepID=UPI00379FB19F
MASMLIGAIVALLFTEAVDICPWLAARMVRASARRIPNPKLALRFEEEWLGVVERRPGKLLKLVSALGIVILGGRKVRASMRSAPKALRMQRWRTTRHVFAENPLAAWGWALILGCSASLGGFIATLDVGLAARAVALSLTTFAVVVVLLIVALARKRRRRVTASSAGTLASLETERT